MSRVEARQKTQDRGEAEAITMSRREASKRRYEAEAAIVLPRGTHDRYLCIKVILAVS